MYSLVIPPELVSKLYNIREKTGKSIRKQILEAINNAISEFKELEKQSINDFISAESISRIDGGEKNGTA